MGSRNQTVKKDQFFPTKIIFLIQDKELEIFPPVSTKKNIPIYMKALKSKKPEIVIQCLKTCLFF